MKRILKSIRIYIRRILLRLLCYSGLHPWGRWTRQPGSVTVKVRQCPVCEMSQVRSARK